MLRALATALTLLAGAAAAQDRPVVATVAYPLAWFAERLGGDAIDVQFPVPEGRDPAFWRPGLSEIAAFQQADVIALNGADFAAWTTRASLPRSRIVRTADGFSDAFIATESLTHSHGSDGEHSHTGTASVTWLDLGQAAMQADALATAMARRLPDLRERIDAEGPRLQADLQALDAEARRILAPLAGATVLTTHPRYQYLARAYGFSVASVDWEAGAMPEPDQWEQLAALARDTDASVLIWEAEPPDAARARADALGLRSVVFSPLANRPGTGDFLSVMRAQIAALGGRS